MQASINIRSFQFWLLQVETNEKYVRKLFTILT